MEWSSVFNYDVVCNPLIWQRSAHDENDRRGKMLYEPFLVNDVLIKLFTLHGNLAILLNEVGVKKWLAVHSFIHSFGRSFILIPFCVALTWMRRDDQQSSLAPIIIISVLFSTLF